MTQTEQQFQCNALIYCQYHIELISHSFPSCEAPPYGNRENERYENVDISVLFVSEAEFDWKNCMDGSDRSDRTFEKY